MRYFLWIITKKNEQTNEWARNENIAGEQKERKRPNKTVYIRTANSLRMHRRAARYALTYDQHKSMNHAEMIAAAQHTHSDIIQTHTCTQQQHCCRIILFTFNLKRTKHNVDLILLLFHLAVSCYGCAHASAQFSSVKQHNVFRLFSHILIRKEDREIIL